MQPAEFEATFRLEDGHWWFVGMRRIAAALLNSLPEAGSWQRLLDVGCGTGGNLALLARYAGQVVGLDVSPTALELCRRRGPWPLLLGSADALPFADGSFDALATFDVLCQLPPSADEAALAEFHRVLRPGGALLVRVPAYQWLWSDHDRVLRTHHRYGAGELGRKLGRAGFEVLRLTYANTLLFPVAAVRRLLQRAGIGGGKSDLMPVPGPVNRACLALMTLEATLVRSASLPFGLSVVALARRTG
ncbi:MAG: methyltransferase domain-containing protein [Chloroflexota bacterium]|nr:methyltransferase domain-containing protein [Chloroflexota bacterium]